MRFWTSKTGGIGIGGENSVVFAIMAGYVSISQWIAHLICWGDRFESLEVVFMSVTLSLFKCSVAFVA
jgi:hypothetical protein